ncbi:uncharacterized protein LOC122643684 [Telopea speciosissima]|uniref:uncharacterized protein LOC122643684 n=1 Tax=Telopea speciosissima TaxID=54955 RepID=UPI001CC37D13|nr:uncharacterized protein LOC122643684 [Telopea speciosissima]
MANKQAALDAQGNFVRDLKAFSAAKAEIDAVVEMVVELAIGLETTINVAGFRVLNNQLLDKGSFIGGSRYYNHTSTQHGESLPKREALPLEPFDICQTKIGSPSLLAQNRKERKELADNKSEKLVLRDGMVLLKKYISHTNQIKIIMKCRDLGLGPGGFYQPVLQNGIKLRRQIMCFGKDWNPQSSSYKSRQAVDGACPPSVPIEFRHLVEDAIQDSHTFLKQELKLWNAEEILPVMSPDICLVNFYTESGKLGLHQDKDESQESLRSGLPVVSFSIGDSAEFLYGDSRNTETAEKVTLESGDVLIFGGKSRLIYHGVGRIMPNSAPSFLVEEANLRPGRINLTFREF